ncbi:hypothetical protein F5050DRAFT_1715984 [Lentinula boryana]|uniref:Uncharacterized protein n=1 Tax=Lentinula boryana TaxID=40481 RepID=A0ABQ8PZ57_9AGAR|nr:hypothetical protein F5050DRAFT_1715984 [Lentinula boryana]
MNSGENDMSVDQTDNSTTSFDVTMLSFLLDTTGPSTTDQQNSDLSIYGSMHAPSISITQPNIVSTASYMHCPSIPEELHFTKGNAVPDAEERLAKPKFHLTNQVSDKRIKSRNHAGAIRNHHRFHRAQERKRYIHLKKKREEDEKLLMHTKEVMFLKALRDHEAMERNRQKKDPKKHVVEREKICE